MWAAGYHKIQPPGSIMAANLHAIKDGISLWKHHQPSTLNVFSDSLDVIHSLYSPHKYIKIKETLIHDIKALIENPSVKEV